jgi:hypothetical protein
VLLEPQSTGVDRPGDLFRLWLEFDLLRRHGQGMIAVTTERRVVPGQNLVGVQRTAALLDGCGVSGYDEDDCLALVREQLFEGRELPAIPRRVPSVDISTLPKHVRDGMGVPVYRGVWFPALNREPPR